MQKYTDILFLIIKVALVFGTLYNMYNEKAIVNFVMINFVNFYNYILISLNGTYKGISHLNKQLQNILKRIIILYMAENLHVKVIHL